MTISETKLPTAERLPYEKPALRSISLVADQVLGIGCKTMDMPYAVMSPTGCLTGLCANPGT